MADVDDLKIPPTGAFIVKLKKADPERYLQMTNGQRKWTTNKEHSTLVKIGEDGRWSFEEGGKSHFIYQTPDLILGTTTDTTKAKPWHLCSVCSTLEYAIPTRFLARDGWYNATISHESKHIAQIELVPA